MCKHGDLMCDCYDDRPAKTGKTTLLGKKFQQQSWILEVLQELPNEECLCIWLKCPSKWVSKHVVKSKAKLLSIQWKEVREPREYWVSINKNDEVVAVCDTKEEATIWNTAFRRELIKVREVLD